MRNFSLLLLALLTFSGATTHAQETWLPRTSGVTAHLWGVAYANNQWVAVGEQGTILTSPDAVTWTKRDSGFPARRFLGIAYAKGLWVAVGGTEPLNENLAVIVTSPDGIAWTPRVTTGFRFNNVAFGNGTFVVVNDVGDLYTSLDGLTWRRGAAGPGRYLRGLAYGAPVFVTTGLSGITSTYDGADAVNRAPGAGQIEGVAWGRNQFVALGTAGLAYTSRDGLAWTRQPTTTTLTGYGAAYFNNQFVAVGDTGIATSFDGTAWTPRPVTLAPDVILLGIAASPTAAVAVGRFGTILQTVADANPPSIAVQPATVTEEVGGNVAFTVTAHGSLPLAYQWQKDGAPLSSGTTDTLLLGSIQSDQAGAFSCVVTNAAGTVTSTQARLTVPSGISVNAPTIVAARSGPLYRELRDGEQFLLQIAATGSAPITYRITTPEGSTSNPTAGSFEISPTVTGVYSLTATNRAGTSASQAVFVRVVPSAPWDPLVDTLPPPSSYLRATIALGANYTFSSTAARGTRPFTYQWFKNGVAIPGATGATYSVTHVTHADDGTYQVVVTNALGSAAMSPFRLFIAQPPTFIAHPTAQTVTAGSPATITVQAASDAAIDYQWMKDGIPIRGATNATYVIASATADDAGSYTVSISNGFGGGTSNPAIVTVLPISWLTNVAVRTTLAANQNLTVGFTVQGGGKPVLVRAVGPGLAALGVVDAMSDPRLSLFDGSAALVAANDNWAGNASVATAMTQVGAFPFAGPLSLDGALVRTISGSHSVQVSGAGGGNVLVEVYDASPGGSPRLTNLSALNAVGTGGDVLIAGFTLAGGGTKTLLIRAVGPSLVPLGVPGVLADPKLELFNAAQGKIAEDDTYSPALATIFARVGAFALLPNAKDAALLATLPSGAYTCVVSGVNNATGTALVEIYEVP